MLTIRPITAADRATVLPMVLDFYQGPAVDHPVDHAVLERSFDAAANPEEFFLDGWLILEADQPVGYFYVSNSYSPEAGGRQALIEELYFLPDHRGKGYGTQAFQFVMDHYAGAIRLRLEVAETNPDAARLYRRIGFDYLPYRQMVLDRQPAD